MATNTDEIVSITFKPDNCTCPVYWHGIVPPPCPVHNRVIIDFSYPNGEDQEAWVSVTKTAAPSPKSVPLRSDAV